MICLWRLHNLLELAGIVEGAFSLGLRWDLCGSQLLGREGNKAIGDSPSTLQQGVVGIA